MAWTDKQTNKQIDNKFEYTVDNFKPRPNVVPKRGKLKTRVYLQLRFATPQVLT